MGRLSRALSTATIAIACAVMPLRAQAPDSGTVELSVVPEATVFVDRDRIGTVSTRTLSLAPGRYVITFNHPDYRPLRRTINVVAKEKKTLNIDLAEKGIPIDPSTRQAPGNSALAAAAPQDATLRVRLEPRARLTIDGRMVGDTDAHTAVVAPGRHVLQIVHPDYQPLQRTITVAPGDTADVFIKLAEVGKKKQ